MKKHVINDINFHQTLIARTCTTSLLSINCHCRHCQWNMRLHRLWFDWCYFLSSPVHLIARLALHIFIVSVITRNLYLTLRMSAWRRHIAASALNVAFARTIAWCLSTMSWAVNTCLGIASDIESTSLLCWPSGAGARHRRRMSS